MDFYLFLLIIAAASFSLLGTKIVYMVYGKFKLQDNKSIASSSSPPSSLLSLPRNWIYDVFPSFHGADVRRSFLSHIMKEFRSKGINPFIDNEIKRGEFIGPELKTAIQGSKIAIVLLSKNYASSSWCLDELVEIMKCKKVLGQTVIAIFYEVDPSDIKKQAGDFGKVFRKTCKGKTNEVIGKWKEALAQVAIVAGYHSTNWDDEAKMIEDIATEVLNKLINSTPSRDFDEFIGMEAHMERMDLLLRPDFDEVRMIGIWGPPGIGKSTIARVIFNQHSHKFQLSVFVENIKAMSPRAICSSSYSLKLYLQQKFISQVIKQEDVKISHLGVAKERLGDKKVLAVLDDVDSLEQLEAMAEETGWFGHGSRIIITTQDRTLLRAHRINHIYEVPFPSTNEALQIFCTYAFRQKYPEDGFEKLAKEVTSLAGELPLGLEVMGSYLRGMSKDEWLMELPRLRTSLNRKIENVLKYSYDALDEKDQYLFLHIACFFNFEKIEKVVEYLVNGFHYDVRRGLNVLAEKSLISITQYSNIRMHSLLVQLGEKIVREQSLSEPGQRQFLVDNGEISEILIDVAAGSRNVIGLNFDSSKSEFNISEKAFQRMSNLQFLKIKGYHCSLHLPHGSLSYLSPKLRLLYWPFSPMTCFPSNVNLEFLVELYMPNSKLQKFWEGVKDLTNLKWINLKGSENLKELPDLSMASNLEILDLNQCSSLVELPSSIGNATNLQKLYLMQCSSLVKLPSSTGNALTNLQELDLRQCSSLVELPSSIGNAINLQKLDLRKCSSLVELPPSIGNATNLQELYLMQCSSLVELPSSIGNATNLQKLDLRECSSLVELPSSIGNATNLQELYLRKCSSLVELPSSIGNATNLQKLNLCECSSLVELPSSIGNATNLQELDLSECSSLVELPSSIGNATNLQELYLRKCSSLVELPSSIGNATNLQKLDLSECSSLVELPSSIGNATNLQELYLRQCSSLVELPSSIGNATNVQELDLSECSVLVELPSSIGNATNLQELYLRKCSSLVELPSSIGNATNLQKLDLSECSSLVELPSSIGNATNLQELYLRQCSSLVELHSSIGNATNLQKLDLRECSSLVELPSSIGNATNLQKLYLMQCSSLVELPLSIWNALTNLRELYLRQCSSLVELPSSIGNATNLQKLDLRECSSLVELPSSIGNATNLQNLDLSECSSLVELPSSIGSATNLQKLNLSECSSLVELPSSIGYLHKLSSLYLKGCSKLEVLPVNTNLKSLDYLDLSDCSSLKSFPEISTNIKYLDISGTAIEEVPSSIRTWSRLDSLYMSYSEKLQEFPHALGIITELYVTDTEIEDIGPWVKGISRLREFILVGCKKLISLPQLPDSLSRLYALNCESLERLDCSFQNPNSLYFINCFKLNQEARDLIIKTSTRFITVLSGIEIPTYFTYRANGGSLIVKLKERPFPSSLKFKACILLTKKNDVEARDAEMDTFPFWIRVKQNSSSRGRFYIPRLLTKHLYIFEFKVDVASNELSFEFEISSDSINIDEWMIKECGCIPEKEFAKEEE